MNFATDNSKRMLSPLVGRTEEKKNLTEALHSTKPEMISLIGRRRVGKTFLVRSVYGEKIDFEITGIQYASRQEQLQNFTIKLSEYFPRDIPISPPKNWIEAFHFLSKLLEKKKKKGKLIVFLDELPWLSTHKSGFLKGLSFFWNSWAINQSIVVVICGSAASWMIRKVVHHKGGLHNRITRRIALKPFSLSETEAFLQSKNLNFDRYQILHLYMALGGVPLYLDEVKGGMSAAQNINNICFRDSGLLVDEFPKLYSALFDNSEKHVKVIRALGSKRMGMTRKEIVSHTKLQESGAISLLIEELLYSGFISVTYPFGKKKKDSLYRLTDEFSLFYLKFMEKNVKKGEGVWQQFSETPTYKSWVGYTFESICIKHVEQLKKALGISGVFTYESSFLKQGNKNQEGLQVDLLIDRKDHVINLCEMKFYNAQLSISKDLAIALRSKVAYFKELSNTQKQVFLTLISTFGIKENSHSLGLIDNSLTLEDLF